MKAAGIPKHIPGEGKVDFHGCRVAYVSFVLQAGATVKEAQSLARHTTPGLTMNTYGRTRRDRLAGIAEAVGSSILRPESTTGAQRKAVGDGTRSDASSYMVEDRGFEPLTSWLPARRSPS